MIDPTKITNYNLDHKQKEEVLLWWCFAAGHNAMSTAKGIDKFLTDVRDYSELKEAGPFGHIENAADYYGWEQIRQILSTSGLGCWRIKSRTVQELVESDINLHYCTIADLESIYGIGPKTARCFIMHTRKGARVAGLDTHILKFLKENGIAVPKSTPTGKRYKLLEQEFLRLCDEADREPAEYDLEIWNKYSGHQ